MKVIISLILFSSFLFLNRAAISEDKYTFDKQKEWFKNAIDFEGFVHVPMEQKPPSWSDWGFKSKYYENYISRFTKVYEDEEDEFILNERNMPFGVHYRPMNKGGIANRPYASYLADHLPKHKYYTLDYQYPRFGDGGKRLNRRKVISRLREMSDKDTANRDGRTDINVLSAIEKYDIAMSFYDFKASKFEIHKRGAKRSSHFSNDGFCNGARALGVNQPEPIHPVTIINREGLTVTFEPIDIKALGSAAYFSVEKYAMLGSPSKNLSIFERRNQNPPNLALFDILLRSFLGREKIPFFIDTSNGNRTVNVTVVGYKRKVRRIKDLSNDQREEFFQRTGKRARKVAHVRTVLKILGEVPLDRSNRPTKRAIARDGEYLKKHTIRYHLYLDSNNRILDGKLTLGGLDMVWIGRGKGTDSTYRRDGVIKGNKLLNYQNVKSLIDLSASRFRPRPMYSSRVLLSK